MEEDGIYLVNIAGNYRHGRYMPSFIHTLRQSFDYVYVFGTDENWQAATVHDFVIVATDHRIDLADYLRLVTESGKKKASGYPWSETTLEELLAERDPVLITDDYAPTDILIAPLFQESR